MTTHPLEEAIEIVGLRPLAAALGVSYQALRKWQRARRMPRTEWTGETQYAETIERITGGRVSQGRLKEKWPEWLPGEVTASTESPSAAAAESCPHA